MQESYYGVKHMASQRILRAKHKRPFSSKNQREGLTRVILKVGSKKPPSHAPFHKCWNLIVPNFDNYWLKCAKKTEQFLIPPFLFQS